MNILNFAQHLLLLCDILCCYMLKMPETWNAAETHYTDDNDRSVMAFVSGRNKDLIP